MIPDTANIPLQAKAIAIGRWHQEALTRRGAVIRQFRGLHEIARALEGFWIVLEACLAHLEGRSLTQKDLAARATGTASPATISRAIQDIEAEGWIVTRASDTDTRVQVIELTPVALEFYLSRVEDAWTAFWSIAATALQAASGADQPQPADPASV
jgi:DNA-binding MarR family transcriptional regulator